jgi:hypothetical protein
MIPIKLQMRNFMCYRDNVPPLSFEGEGDKGGEDEPVQIEG